MSRSGERRERELERELRDHLDLEAAEHRDDGLSPHDAEFAARRALGNTTWIREEVRTMWGWTRFETVAQDVRFGARQLLRAPGFTAIGVLTLALGIGANTSIYSVMHAALLRYLPVPHPERLVFLNTTFSFGAQSGDGDTSLTEYIFEQMRAQRDVFTDVAGFAPVVTPKAPVRYASEPEEAEVDLVSGSFFSALGIRPAMGRTFTMEDEAAHAPLAVVSYAWWSVRHGRDPEILGHTLSVKGVPLTIIGVAAPGFDGVENRRTTDIWIPLQLRAELQPWGQPPGAGLSLYGSSHLWWALKAIGRLQPGITEKQAIARLQPVFQHAALDGQNRNPKFDKPQVYFTPARGVDGMREAYGEPLTVLMVMVGVVLLIACANIATMLAARNTARAREFSLRMAIGGSRPRLFRQLLTESLLLVGTGGALGWLFAQWATRALAAWTNLDLNLAPDGSVLWFTAAVSVAVGMAFAMAPLRSVLRIPIAMALKTAAATANRDRERLRGGSIVVAAQMALCLTLLVGAGLLLQSLQNLKNVDLGIRTQGLLVFGVSPTPHSDDEAIRFYEAMLTRLRSLPGVEGVTLSRQRPGSGWSANSSVQVDGRDPKGDDNSHMRWNGVAADYFHVMGTPVLRGRDFNQSDTATSPKVVVINQTFAKDFLPGRDPIGHQVTRGGNPPATIVGIVRDNKYTGVREDATPMAWFPYTQFQGLTSMHAEVRTAGSPLALLPEVRRAMFQFGPDVPLLQPMTLEEQFERSYADGRLLARLGIFFGLLAALLVATGLYGTLSYTVSRRTAEVGIRMALGAQRLDVLWMVLRSSMVVAVAGIATGIPLAIFSAGFLRSMLFGVKPGNAEIFAAALSGMVLVAVVASLVPARRAASVDPIVALRHE